MKEAPDRNSLGLYWMKSGETTGYSEARLTDMYLLTMLLQCKMSCSFM